MATELTIPTILSIAKICEYLNAVKSATHTIFKGGDISKNRDRLIYMERVGIQRVYDLNPNDPTLRGTANYLFSLLRYQTEALRIFNNLSVAGPVLTGPANQSVNAGDTATFTVSAAGVAPFTYQWFDSFGNPIGGATGSSYAFTNAQVSDSGKTFFVKVTDANGKTATSATATLTVAAILIGYWYMGGTDFGSQLESGVDNVTYSGTFVIVNGQPLVVPFPIGGNNYAAVKYPVSQSVKTQYQNPTGGIDNGPVPGLALEENAFGGWNYIFTRPATTFGVNNLTGIVTFL